MSEERTFLSPANLARQGAQEQRTLPPLRIAIFGFGTVGSSVARILVESKPEGLELTHVYNRNVARKRVDWVPSSVVWSEDFEAVLASDVDVVVELVGGLDPAGSWLRRTLDAGKSAVTANKKLIAYQGRQGWPLEIWRRCGRGDSCDSRTGTRTRRGSHRAHARHIERDVQFYFEQDGSGC